MKNRFYLLALLSGLFLIVSLPVGIVFFIFVALYYVASNKQPKPDESDSVTRSSESDSVTRSSEPDFNTLFNNDDFVEEQEKLR